MNAFELRMLPLAELRPADYNPRKFSAAAYRKLKASLETFGLVEPLIWNETTGHVVGGHLRLRILKELGVATVPVSVVRLGDAEEKALNIVLNNLEAQGRYDPVKLAELLTNLEELPQLAATGFDASMLKTLTFAPKAIDQEEDAETVEIVLQTTAAVYESLAPRLDVLIRDYDLHSHVKRK